jgi:twitching motility protein PilT
VDAQQGTQGGEGYFGSAPSASSPLDPTWTPAPQLQPMDVLDLAAPSMAFAPAPAQPPRTVEVSPAPEPALLVAPFAAPIGQPLPSVVEPLVAAMPILAPELASPSTAEEESLAVRVGAEDTSDDSGFLSDLLIETLDRGCSDLHLTVGAPPTVRLHGALTPMEGRALMTPQMLVKVLYAILSQKQREKFEQELELDFSYSVPGRARFRVNIYRQRDALGAAFRLIPFEIKPLEELGVPPTVGNFAMLPRGFVLVTGPTGSGKSTTLAAVVDKANRSRRDHIMTVEDPIEFLHEHKSCLVNQREVGEDTHSFKNALKHVLRQDPDIILVGEMRDLETIEIALTAAETGHLVMATLHTQDAAQTIDRVIDVFPPHQQQQVRVQLAGALQGVVCQQLLKTADGKGRVVATEVLVATPAIRNLIREGKTHQIYSAMQAGAKHGMATMDQHLAQLVKQGKITYDNALEKCHHVEDFQRLCGRA